MNTSQEQPTDKKQDPPPSPPLAFFHPRRVWGHVRQYRDIYLFPLVGGLALYFMIRCVNLLTGRAVVDDPGVIIAAMYNIFIILLDIGVLGALQGFIIPDLSESKPAASWPIHLINVLCTIIVFALLLHFTFR